MRFFARWIVGLLVVVWAGDAHGQFRIATPQAESLGEVATQRWQIGFIFSAPGGPCRNIMATQSVPMDWPEQTVRIVDQDVSAGVDVDYRPIGESAQQMVVKVSRLPAGAEVQALITFETRRGFLLAPSNPEQFTLPSRTRLPASMRRYLSPSPYIESTDRTIRDLASQIVRADESPWNRAEAIYDWVRTNVEFSNDQGLLPVDTLTTLKQKHGDCDEMSCLFIALSRASGIPARLVQVPGHVYAEFYLVDREGEGHWLPCQLAGTRAFGHMPEHRPVLQKGDNLSSPHAGPRKHLILPQHMTATSGAPEIRPVVQRIGE